MIHIASEENYGNGQIIFKEGSHGDWIYEVLSGAVEISKIIGDKRIVIKTLGPGEVFGELGFLADIPRTATATAVGETAVGVIDRSFLDREFNKLSSGFRKILKTLAIRLSETTEIAIRAIAKK